MINKLKENYATWMGGDEMPKAFVFFAEEFAKELVNGRHHEKMTTTQVRNFFGEVRRIQMKGFEANKGDFHMLRPKLAYSTARAKKGNKIYDFKEVVDYILRKVDSEKEFKRFTQFLEATVAFHKTYGGK